MGTATRANEFSASRSDKTMLCLGVLKPRHRLPETTGKQEAANAQ